MDDAGSLRRKCLACPVMGQLLDLLARIRLSFHRRVLVHRRPLAALAAAVAVLAGVHATAPAPPPTVAVWTARQALPSGHVLTAADLVRVPFRPGTAPADRLGSARAAVGRTVAAPLGAGEPVTAGRLLGPALLRGHPGTVAVPARVTDPAVVGLLRVGDRVSVLATDPQGTEDATVLAPDATVLALPRSASDAGTGLPGRLVVFAVPREAAPRLAAAAARAYLTVLWSR